MKYCITIEELRNRPECIPAVVKWLHNEWGHNNENYWTSWIQHSMQQNDIPKTYILFVNGQLVGTYSLWRCDLQSRQDLFPWFGGMYVCTKYRGKSYNGQKLGEILQNHAVTELKRLRYQKAYLFTEHSPAYYERNGWEYLCQAPNERDQLVSVCYRVIR